MQTDESRFVDILAHEQLTPFYQPIWRLKDCSLLGFEILSRFPYGLTPGEVWQWAYAADRWVELDRLTLRLAMEQSQNLPGLLFFNLSTRRLVAPKGAPHTFPQTLVRYGRSGKIVFEVTEETIDNVLFALREVRSFRQLGVQFALDDANSGASNPERLQWLRPDYIKIDRPVVNAFLEEQDRTLTHWVALAREMQSIVIAEGIENRDAVETLYRAGVDAVQGFAFGRPAPSHAWTDAELKSAAPALPHCTQSTPEIHAAAAEEHPRMRIVEPLASDQVGLIVFNNYPEPMFIVDEQGRLVSLNPAAERIWNAVPEELMGVFWMHAFHIRWGNDQVVAENADWSKLRPVFAGGDRVSCIVVDRNGQVHNIMLVGNDVQHQAQHFTLFVVVNSHNTQLPSWALTDPLTGLGNRVAWDYSLPQWNQSQGMIGMADVDRLKTINDIAGHLVGDQVLTLVGHILSQMLPPGSTAYRYGGDEFVVVMPGLDPQKAEAWGEEINARLRQEEILEGVPLHLCWGWSPFLPQGVSESLIQADEAMYTQKGVILKSAQGGRLILIQTQKTLLETPHAAEPSPRPGRFAEQFGMHFDRAFRTQFQKGEDLAQSLIDWIDPHPGTAVLEVGAGAGRLAFDGGLAQRIGPSGQLLLTDPARAQLELAQDRAMRLGFPWIRFLQAPAEELPLASGGADLVLGAMFLHLCNPQRALHEMARVTRPGGRIAVSVVLKFPWPQAWRDIWEPAQRVLAYHGLPMRFVFDYLPGETARWCESVGLTVEKTEIVDAGNMEFPDVEMARKFVEQGGHLQVMIHRLPEAEQSRVQAMVDRQMRQVFARTSPDERAVKNWHLENVIARSPR